MKNDRKSSSTFLSSTIEYVLCQFVAVDTQISTTRSYIGDYHLRLKVPGLGMRTFLYFLITHLEEFSNNNGIIKSMSKSSRYPNSQFIYQAKDEECIKGLPDPVEEFHHEETIHPPKCLTSFVLYSSLLFPF